MNKFFMFIPLVLFVGLVAFFIFALEQRKSTPVSALASALIDRPFPEFELQDLQGRTRTRDDLVTGEPTLVNIWGSWCPACLDEHPYLGELARNGVRLVAINYKDNPQSAAQWLQAHGDIAEFHIQDVDGRLGIDLGVYGAPETYLIDGQGFIRFKQVGVVDEQVWAQMRPIYEQWSQVAASSLVKNPSVKSP